MGLNNTLTILDKDGYRVWIPRDDGSEEVYYMKLCRSIMKGSKDTFIVWRDIDQLDVWNGNYKLEYFDDMHQIQRWYRNSSDLGNLRMHEWQYSIGKRDIFQSWKGYSKLMTAKWFNENLKNNPNWYGFYSIWTEFNNPDNLGLIEINGKEYSRQQLDDFLCRRIKIKSLLGCVNDLEVGEKK